MWPATQGEITVWRARICEAACVRTWTFDCEVKSAEEKKKNGGKIAPDTQSLSQPPRFVIVCY